MGGRVFGGSMLTTKYWIEYMYTLGEKSVKVIYCQVLRSMYSVVRSTYLWVLCPNVCFPDV